MTKRLLKVASNDQNTIDFVVELIVKKIPIKYKVAVIKIISLEILTKDQLKFKKIWDIWCKEVQLLIKYSFIGDTSSGYLTIFAKTRPASIALCSKRCIWEKK